MTYAVDGGGNIMLSDKDLVDVGPERAVLVGFAVFISILAAKFIKTSY